MESGSSADPKLRRKGVKIIFGVVFALMVLALVSAGDYRFQNSSDVDVVIIEGATGNLNISGDFGTVGTGFFGWLGSLTNRISKLWVTDINASGNISADYFIGDGSLLTGISDSGIWDNVSNVATYEGDVNITGIYYGDGSGLTNLGGLFESSGWANDSTTTSTSLNVDVGSGKFYVNSTSGNVGIGTTSPAYKLDVNGTINAESLLVNGVPVASSTDTYWENNSNDIYYNSGNVGIGTGSPQNKLNVIGDVNFTGLIYGDGSQLTGITGGNSSWNQSLADTLYSTIDEPLWTANFTAYNSSWSSTYNSTYDGYNSSGLIINWSTDLSNYYLNSNPSDYWNDTYATFNKTYADTLYADIGAIGDTYWENNSNDIYYNSGNVGIGTSSPNATLEINGSSTNVTEPQLRIYNPNNGTGNSSGIRLRTAGGWDVKLQTVQGVDWLQLTNNVGNVFHSWSGDKYYPGTTSNGGTNTGYISGDGTNVGIGTTSPAYKLDVNGTINAESLLVNGVPVASSSDTYWENNSNDIYYNSGNVGIGTSSPTAHLTISKSGAPSIHLINTDASYPDDDAYIVSYQDKLLIQNRDADGTYRTAPATFNLNAPTNSLYLDSTGNVGIGTSSPDEMLDVVGGNTIVDDYFYIRDYDDGTISNPTRMISRDGNILFWDSGVVIGTYSDGALSDLGTGNMLIQGTLDVGGNVLVSGSNINMDNGLSDGSGILFSSSGNTAYEIDNSAGALRFFQPGLTRMTINSAGSVGIGTTTPDKTLEVIGDVVIGAEGDGLIISSDGYLSDEDDTVTISDELTVTGSTHFNIGDSIYFENDKHAITYNDGQGNFNIRIGHVSNGSTVEEVTEAGYPMHMEFDQSNGRWQMNVDGTSRSVGDVASWTHTLQFDKDGILKVDTNEVWHSGSDGSGSTLDADYLDTISSSSFLRSDTGDVYNDAGAAIDLRFEGDNDANLLFLDGSTDRIGIGTSSPGAELTVAGTSPIIEIKDSDNTGDGAIAYLSFLDSVDTRYGYVGLGSTSNDDIYLNADSGNIHLRTNTAGGVLTVTQGGNVGIGTTSPLSKLSVGGSGNSNYAIYGTTTSIMGRGISGVASASTGFTHGVHGLSSSSTGMGVYGSGKAYDFYAGGGGTDYGPFTGGHEVKFSENFPEDIKAGMIVSVTGETQIRYDSESIDISSTLPTVELSNAENDKRILGVFTAEFPLFPEHWYYNLSSEDDRFGTANALGEGRVWVTNINGDVEAGDYITSSNVSGYGQEQGDDLLHSYTLGKSIEDVDWDGVTEVVVYEDVEYKAYLIGVVYVSG